MLKDSRVSYAQSLLRAFAWLLIVILQAVPTWADDVKSAAIPSLEGTVADGSLRLAADGSLMIDAELRHFFDYFLSARGEVADRLLVERMGREAAVQLPAAAAAEASALFASYLRYADVAAARLDGIDRSKLTEAFGQLEKTRREVLGENAASGLFQDQLALERSALLLQQAHLDAKTPAERAASLLRYEASLDPEERRARRAATLPLRVAAKVSEMRLGGASEEEVWAVRARAFGSDAADRLRALDQRRAGR